MRNRFPSVTALGLCAGAAILVGCWTAPSAQAQTPDLRRLWDQATRAAAEAERRVKREEIAGAKAARGQDCEQIQAWLADTKELPEWVLARRFGGSQGGDRSDANQIPYESWLFQDLRFMPAFGTRFDEVPPERRQQFQSAGSGCQPPRNDKGQAMADHMLFSRAFNDRYYPRYVQGVVRIRQAHAKIDVAMTDLAALSADDEGMRRFREHANASKPLFAYMNEARRREYQQALRKAFEQVARPYHVQAISAVAAGAQGYEGLAKLVALQAEMSRDAELAGLSAAVSPETQAKLSQLGQEVAAVERSRIDALGTGVVGLERGVQWHGEAAKRLDGRMTSSVPELRGVLSYFAQKREQDLNAAELELARRITAANNTAELQQLVSRYFPLQSDQQTRAGTALMTKVAMQQEELQKRSVIGAASGANPNPGGSGPTPAAQPARPVASATGEPSESEMYDALSARLQGQNEEARRIAERCNNREFNRGQGDPMLAMMCLQYGVGVGTTGGGQGVAAPAFKISRFQKIACEKAQGEAGYYCDYVAGISGNLNLPPSMADMVSAGSVSQARFVRRDAGWLLLPLRQR